MVLKNNIAAGNDAAYSGATLLSPDTVSGSEVCAHSVQFYADDTYLLDELSRSLGSALGAGDAVVVIATGAHREELQVRLESRGINTEVAVKQGRFVPLDAGETLSKFMVGARPDPSLFANIIGSVVRSASSAAGSNARVLAFGEMVALLWADGNASAAIELERLWNDLARTHAFDLQCAYPMSLFPHAGDTAGIEEICAAHSHVIPTEGFTSLVKDDQRLRAVAILEQKAQALENEIEERKKAQQSLEQREAELADFLENALEGVLQVGAGRNIVWANRAVLDLLGYTTEETVGHGLDKLVANKAEFEEFWQKLMRREDIYDFALALRCKDGSIRYVQIHSNGLWKSGRFKHARCFLRDVTEQKRMEQALHERNHELSRAVAARDEFLSIAAHELKTPITTLRGFSQLLLRDAQRKRETPQDRLTAALYAIEGQTGKLTHLMARLLDTSQIEAGKLRIEPVRTDLVALARAAISQQRGHDLHTVVYEGPEHLEANVDPVRFEQVITNLLDNAVKFSPEGGRVTLRLGRAANNIQLSVTDEGLGVSPEHHETIFSRFVQAKPVRHLSGIGLGLYITRQIVELHGGRVRVEEPGHQGSRFVVTIPAHVGAQ